MDPFVDSEAVEKLTEVNFIPNCLNDFPVPNLTH